jgi:CheY-like chemotaxis protein
VGHKILAVDDELFNLDILSEYLEAAGYLVITAQHGEAAIAALHQHPDIACIVLDRMMPGINGVEVVKRLKGSSLYRDIPVIMQTAAGSPEQIADGIAAGVYYYLTKPYAENVLLALVAAAIEDAAQKRAMRESVAQSLNMGTLDVAFFRFRSLQEARSIAIFLAQAYPSPIEAVYGLTELMLNAVEHGNLGIDYAQKGALIASGTWESEIASRLQQPMYRDRYAAAIFDRSEKEIVVRIKDEGQGFDWEKYLTIDASRATHAHGRGIATSAAMSFDSIQYVGKGNEVIAKKNLQ